MTPREYLLLVHILGSFYRVWILSESGKLEPAYYYCWNSHDVRRIRNYFHPRSKGQVTARSKRSNFEVGLFNKKYAYQMHFEIHNMMVLFILQSNSDHSRWMWISNDGRLVSCSLWRCVCVNKYLREISEKKMCEYFQKHPVVDYDKMQKPVTLPFLKISGWHFLVKNLSNVTYKSQ